MASPVLQHLRGGDPHPKAEFSFSDPRPSGIHQNLELNLRSPVFQRSSFSGNRVLLLWADFDSMPRASAKREATPLTNFQQSHYQPPSFERVPRHKIWPCRPFEPMNQDMACLWLKISPPRPDGVTGGRPLSCFGERRAGGLAGPAKPHHRDGSPQTSMYLLTAICSRPDLHLVCTNAVR
jgi:hypothetical protein